MAVDGLSLEGHDIATVSDLLRGPLGSQVVVSRDISSLVTCSLGLRSGWEVMRWCKRYLGASVDTSQCAV